jgi:hypothetical protein
MEIMSFGLGFVGVTIALAIAMIGFKHILENVFHLS